MADERPTPPLDLLDRLWADPVRAPETLALAAARRHGPAAAAWIDEQRVRDARDAAALARTVKRQHARYARVGGAITGVGGALTIVPDLLAVAWIQSRLVFFVAAAFDFDPRDPMRPAELLVLQGLYSDPNAARAALDGAGTPIAQAYVSNRAAGGGALVPRLTRMAGARAGRRLAGRAIPGFAIVFNAASNERHTRALANRAIAFYGG